MTPKERTQELIDLLSSYGIHSKTIAKDIVKGILKGIDKIYDQYNSEVDSSKELLFKRKQKL